MITGRKIPHPIPYQGSKREIAHRILPLFPKERVRLFEPFAGSAAVSLAAAANGLVSDIVLNDINIPLMRLWKRIIHEPEELLETYTRLWKQQLGKERAFYDEIREKFNKTRDPDLLLYLLARCVKASVRYNANGEFNQSPDNRRKGAKPETMAMRVLGASRLLSGITVLRHVDFVEAISDATQDDVIYMDPPYQGVCGSRDNRYSSALSFEQFCEALREMNKRKLSFIISYDGRSGAKKYGDYLPNDLSLTHIEVNAGVSSQATLLGRNAETVESLYLSHSLVKRIGIKRIRQSIPAQQAQLTLF